MINSISPVNGYSNTFDITINPNAYSKSLVKPNVNDVASINSANIMDDKIGSAFNNVMSDLRVGNTDLADLHGGLNLDRVKALLSL